MEKTERASEPERRDWTIIVIILLIGFLCVIVAGSWALRFSPSWQLDTDMGSNIDPNRDFLTNKPQGFIEPVDMLILTPPDWMALFLTPGAEFSTGTPLPPPPPATSTIPGTIAVPATFTPVTASPTNTLVWIPLPPTSTRRPPSDPPTNTPLPSVDLQIGMSDGGFASYTPNTWLTYTVVVTNPSTYDVPGVIVRDLFSVQIDDINWSCAPAPICISSGTSDITDTINMPAGSVVTYTVNVHISIDAMGPLENIATVTTPAGFNETDNLNNSASDTNSDPALSLNIGPPDGDWRNLLSGGSVTMVISPAITGDGNPLTYDFVYYERRAPGAATLPAYNPRVDLDQVQILISNDGVTWHQVFYWGDGLVDSNTNVAIPVNGIFCPAEIDNCQIPEDQLFESTGIAIDIDSLGLSGSYPWISITCPMEPFAPFDGCDIDAIRLLP